MSFCARIGDLNVKHQRCLLSSLSYSLGSCDIHVTCYMLNALRRGDSSKFFLQFLKECVTVPCVGVYIKHGSQFGILFQDYGAESIGCYAVPAATRIGQD